MTSIFVLIVALTYSVLPALTCKTLGYIRRFPGFLLTRTLGARAGAVHLRWQAVGSLMLLGLR